jgi:hypothetical protein
MSVILTFSFCCILQLQDPPPPPQTAGEDPIGTSHTVAGSSQSMTMGLSEGGFDREGWNDTTNILRDLDEDLTQPKTCGEKEASDQHKVGLLGLEFH